MNLRVSDFLLDKGVKSGVEPQHSKRGGGEASGALALQIWEGAYFFPWFLFFFLPFFLGVGIFHLGSGW